MLVPVTVGAIVGVIGFLPLGLSIKLSKKVTPTSNIGYGALTMIGVFASMTILAISVLICYFCFRDILVPFTLACAITLLLIAVIFGIYVSVSRKKFEQDRKNKTGDFAKQSDTTTAKQNTADSNKEICSDDSLKNSSCDSQDMEYNSHPDNRSINEANPVNVKMKL